MKVIDTFSSYSYSPHLRISPFPIFSLLLSYFPSIHSFVWLIIFSQHRKSSCFIYPPLLIFILMPVTHHFSYFLFLFLPRCILPFTFYCSSHLSYAPLFPPFLPPSLSPSSLPFHISSSLFPPRFFLIVLHPSFPHLLFPPSIII